MLRFPSYSSEWHSYTLGEILTFYSTNSFSREKLNYDTGSVKNIHYGDIHTKFPSIVSVSDNKDIPFINNEIDLSKYSEDQYLQNGDLIIADASEDYEDIGKAIEVKNIDDEKVLAGLHTILARDNNNITVNGFKAYLFSTNSLKTKIKIIANGISVLGISKNSLSKLTVNVPSKNEQNDVVDFISLIDNKIELLEQKHQYYLDFKKFLMQQIFTQKLRFDFKDTWDKVLLKDVAFIPKKTKLTNVEGLKLLTVKLHTKGIEINDRIKPKLTKRGRPYYIRRSGELLIGRQNFHNGGMGIVPKSLDGGICSNAISSFNVFEDKIDVNYLYYFLARPEYYIKSERLIGGTGQKEFSEKELLKLKIDLPSLEEQNKIVDFLLNIDHKIELSENQLNKTQEFKKGLLQQMFV